MVKCQLSDRQKALLRALAIAWRKRPDPGVRWWVRMPHDAARPQWQNVERDDLRVLLDDTTELADIIAFQECGFITNTQPGRFDVDEPRLLEAVDRDFFEGE